MKRRDRTLSIFSLSALDLLAMATGTFVLIMVVLLPYYRKTLVAKADIEEIQSATATVTAEVDAVLRAGAADADGGGDIEREILRLEDAAARSRLAAASRRQEATAADGRAGDAERLVAELQAQVRQRFIKELDLVFVVDTTASMTQVLREIALSLNGIVRVLQRLVPSLRVGYVAYRDYDNSPWPTKALGLTPTTPDQLPRILAFADAMRPATRGGRSVTEAVYAGLGQATALAFRPGAKVTLIVVGDAAAHPGEKLQALRLANRFANSAPNRSVSTLFVSTKAYRRWGRGDREYFIELARAGGGGFNDHAGQLAETVLLSVLRN